MTVDPQIRPDHSRTAAVVCVRQSTLHQVRGNRESGARQYTLFDRAKALGWPATAAQTIDEDQGRSGAHADQRQGFKMLLAEIGAGQVGMVLALEGSRLARPSPALLCKPRRRPAPCRAGVRRPCLDNQAYSEREEA